METIGPYRLEAEVGRGAMGVVFRGFDPAIGRAVAIKILHPNQLAAEEERAELKLRLAREAAAAGRLSHPNIVTIHQLGEQGDLQYLVLEFVNGLSLEQMLSTGRPMVRTIAFSILSQVADALDYAHGEGVIHRDVKPANILVRLDGKAKITDFGIARISNHPITRTGLTMGTLAYMAPEQILRSRVGGSADQFSLAVTAYQMLSGQTPFVASSEPALLFKIVSEEPPALNEQLGFPRKTSEVLKRAMAKDLDRRYATCKDFVNALSGSLRGTSAMAEPEAIPAWDGLGDPQATPVLAAGQGGTDRKVWHWWAAGGSGVALIAAVGLLVYPSHRNASATKATPRVSMASTARATAPDSDAALRPRTDAAPPSPSRPVPVPNASAPGPARSEKATKSSKPASTKPSDGRVPPPPQAPEREAAATPSKPQPVQVAASIQAANLVHKVVPVYPPLAREARIQGKVVLSAIVGKDGAIQNLQLVSGHPLLAPAAIDAVKQWTYKPTLVNSEPVEVATQIEVAFTLAGPTPSPAAPERAQTSNNATAENPGRIYPIGGAVSAPVIVYRVQPDYTEEARKAKYTGTVLLQVDVWADGTVHNVRVIRNLGLGLDEKAVEAVKRWKFRPGYMDGKPVAVSVAIQIRFNLL